MHRLDVTDRADVAAFVDGAVDRHGRVDVIVNNAGVMPLSRLDSLLVDEWDRMIDVNVRGLLHGIAAALPHFQRAGGGHFVTVASIGAHEVVPTAAVYCATKYAAWAITEGLRLEVDPSIRVTTVSPGVVESELADTITESGRAGPDAYLPGGDHPAGRHRRRHLIRVGPAVRCGRQRDRRPPTRQR